MKRKFKRIASLVLAAVMVFAMAVPGMTAMAADNLKITINDAAEDSSFTAYQIFKGTAGKAVDGEKTVLSDVDWGADITLAGQSAFATAVYTSNGKEVPDGYSAADVAKELEGKTGPQLQELFASLNKEGMLTGEHTSSGNEIVGLDVGYYLIIDKTEKEGKPVEGAGFIVELLGEDVKVTSKTSVPSSEKGIKDKNDSTGAEDRDYQYGGSADYDIGDEVPFQLKATVASNYDEYESYYFAFHDKQSNGLTFNPDSVVVKVGEEELTEDTDYTVVFPATDGDTFDIVFENLKDVSSVKAGSVITVEYTSTLNTNAVLGNEGNPNEMTLQYSNTPQNPEEKGTTPSSIVVVFTYEVDINKVNEKKEPLTGAAFSLQKWNGTAWGEVKAFTAEASGSEFYLEGLDDGYYKLVETAVPDGYNKMADKYFEIKAEHTVVDGKGTTTLHAYYGTWDDTEHTFTQGDEAKDGKFETQSKMEGEVEHSQAIVDTTIINQSGATLPETGGIGTTIFYVVGSVLVLGAVILLVTKRRMKSE